MMPGAAGGAPPPIDTSSLPIPVPSFLEGNPYFSAGFGLAILGASMGVIKRAGVGLQLIATRQFLTTMEISNRDASFPWVLRWLQEQTSNRVRRVSVETSKRQTQSGKSITSFTLVPSQGKHFLWYQNNILMIERDRELRARGGESGGSVWETIKFTSIGRNPNIYENLMYEAQNMATTKDHDYTTIYTSWGHQGWKPFGNNNRKKRDINSVILDKGISDIIVDDLYEFLCSRKWYHERGIPYRRGYLLYGEPGSGKSSFVTALAGHIGYDICVMSLAQPGLTDDHLAVSLINVPEKSIILFEDIDCLFTDRGSTTNTDNENSDDDDDIENNGYNNLNNGFNNDNRKQYSRLQSNSNAQHNDHNYITFSGFLNALDGVSAGEERLVFMTTNHVHKLDPALIRPGRIDNMQYLGAATDYQIRHMFLRFYPEKDIGNEKEYPQFVNIHKNYEKAIENNQTINNNDNDNEDETKLLIEYTQLRALFESEIDSFVTSLSGHGISMAELQEYFLLHKHDAQTALDDASVFVETLLKSPRRKGKPNKKNIKTTQTNNTETNVDNNDENIPHFSEIDLSMSKKQAIQD